jgi:hypothetical protein
MDDRIAQLSDAQLRQKMLQVWGKPTVDAYLADRAHEDWPVRIPFALDEAGLI